MKVLHVIPAVASVRGGPSHAIFAMVKALRSQGVEAEIATTNNNGTAVLEVPFQRRIEYEGVPVWFFPQFPTPRPDTLTLGKDKAFIFSAALTPWLWQNLPCYDLMEAHYLFSYASTCAGMIARMQQIPYVVRTIGQLAPWALAQSRLKKRLYSLLLERQNLNGAAAIHCTSTGETEDVRRYGISTPTFALPLGVELASPNPHAHQTLRDRYRIPATMPVILFLSRLHPKKRPDLLLRSLQRVVQSQDCHAIFAGDGEADYVAYLQSLGAELGLSQQLSFAGFVTGTDKALLLQGADLFVLPSFAENFGVAVAEAMAAGLPVVVTPDVQISPDIVAAEAGIVADGEAEAIAAAILHLLTSPQERRRYGTNGQNLARQRYSWMAIAQQLADIYATILQNRGVGELKALKPL